MARPHHQQRIRDVFKLVLTENQIPPERTTDAVEEIMKVFSQELTAQTAKKRARTSTAEVQVKQRKALFKRYRPASGVVTPTSIEPIASTVTGVDRIHRCQEKMQQAERDYHITKCTLGAEIGRTQREIRGLKLPRKLKYCVTLARIADDPVTAWLLQSGLSPATLCGKSFEVTKRACETP